VLPGAIGDRIAHRELQPAARNLSIRRMRLDDNDLLGFDASTLGMADAGDARRLLREHGDVFRAQLVAARWLDGYRLRRLTAESPTHSEGWELHEEGFDEAMRDVIAHLRQGDFLPGGTLYEDEMTGENERRPELRAPGEDDQDEPPPV
jgi:hypothetical protein